MTARPSGATGWSAGVGLRGTRGQGRYRVAGDVAVLYRSLTSRWVDGMTMPMEGWLDLRFAAGGELRLSDTFR